MIATSIEQSKRLIELGLNPDSSDMCYCIDYKESNLLGKDVYNLQIDTYKTLWSKPDNIPAWSLSALLAVMPMTCDIIKGYDNSYYCSNKFNENPIENWHLTTSCKNPIEAAVEMVVWLIGNHYIC